MFESIVSDALASHLGKFIEGLNSDTLNIAIWTGEVALNNLKLKRDLFSEFDIPFIIKNSTIGKLQISIPWRNILSGKIIIRLTNLSVLIIPEIVENVKIINKITENIEIYIENIHLRFEDFENFFACGATLNSLSLSSQLNDPDSIVNLIKKVTIFFPIFIGQ